MRRNIRFPSIEETEAKLKSGDWQIHKFPLGFIITEIKQYLYPKERVLLIWVLSGRKFDEWKEEAFSRLRAFGAEHGCSAIETQCRLGLVKKLKPLGSEK